MSKYRIAKNSNPYEGWPWELWCPLGHLVYIADTFSECIEEMNRRIKNGI